MTFVLATRCPRLARARDGYLVDRARAAAWERRMDYERLRLDRLVAHRELQLVRAYTTRDWRYIRERQRKLTEAQRLRSRLGA